MADLPALLPATRGAAGRARSGAAACLHDYGLRTQPLRGGRVDMGPLLMRRLRPSSLHWGPSGAFGPDCGLSGSLGFEGAPVNSMTVKDGPACWVKASPKEATWDGPLECKSVW